MPNLSENFGHSDPLYVTIPVALCVALWVLWWMPIVVGPRRDRGLPWVGTLLFAPLGPIALTMQARMFGSKQYQDERFRYLHWPAWIVGSLFVLGVVGATAYWQYVSGAHGEQLHIPVAIALAVSGLVGGGLIAVVGRRVGFVEILGVLWAYSAGLLALNSKLEMFFNFGTTAVFLLVVCLTSVLILLTTLLLGASIGFLATGDGALDLSFSYEAWIGRRYLLAKRRQSFISVITFISIAGVTVGVWAMLVVLSVMSGFEADLKTKILGANAHMIVQKSGGDFSEWEKAIQKVRENPNVTGASPFVFNEVMLSSDTNLTGALIKGIDPKTMDEVSNLHASTVQGSFTHLSAPEKIPDENTPLPKDGEPDVRTPPKEHDGLLSPDPGEKKKDGTKMLPAFGVMPQAVAKGATLPGIAIGQEMARNLRVFLGDRITVVSPVAELGPTGPVPRARSFRVAAIFYTGMYEYDSKFAYIDLKESQSFFSLGNTVTGIEVKVNDIEGTTWIGREIVNTLGGFPFRTRDWKDMNRNLFAALKLEKIAMFIILAFIILVASFNILSTLIMVVLEKGKEIAILKSMGASDASVMKIFVTYGLTIGFFGTSLGLLLGFFSCKAIEKFGIGLDPEVYYIANLPVRMDPVEFTLVALAALVISHLATVYPALQAARLKPVEGLRYE